MTSAMARRRDDFARVAIKDITAFGDMNRLLNVYQYQN
jgi:hypothetical protein